MREDIAEKAASAATGTTYFGASTGVIGWAASIDSLTWVGVALAILGFIVNFYYRMKEDRRAQQRHEIEMERLRVKQD